MQCMRLADLYLSRQFIGEYASAVQSWLCNHGNHVSRVSCLFFPVCSLFPLLPSFTRTKQYTTSALLHIIFIMPNSRTAAAKYSLLPTIVDQLARDEPNSLWGEFPKSKTKISDGYEELTYRQFANAVNAVAHQIEKQIGRRDTREPLAYLAANDPRCSIALVAAMKVGCNVSIYYLF